MKVHWLIFGVLIWGANITNISHRFEISLLPIIMTVVASSLGMWQGMTYGHLPIRDLSQLLKKLAGIVLTLTVCTSIVIINSGQDLLTAWYVGLVWYGTYIVGTQLKYYYESESAEN